jgi:peptidoglycan/LPS O-acetylase OafA/YrhL
MQWLHTAMIYLLEIGRGLAALWVFLFHAKGLFEESSQLVHAFATHGQLGVPVFFVISGYVITYSAESTLKHGKSPQDFLKRRFLRIYPTFWLSVLVVLVVPYIIAAISMLKTGQFESPVMKAFELSTGDWAHLLLLTKGFFAESNDLQAQYNAVNSVYWSLAIEFQFYCLLFLCLWLKKFYRLGVLVVTAIALYNMIFPMGLNPGLFLRYWPDFSVGIALAYLHKYELRMERWIPESFTSYYLVLLAVTVGALSYLYPVFDVGRTAFSLGTGVLIWLASPLESGLANIKRRGRGAVFWILEAFLYLGAMSYSVYLLHGKIFQLPNMFVRQVFPPDNILNAVTTIILTLLLCYPFYCFVERRFMSQNYSKLRKKTLSLGSGENPQALAGRSA